MKHAIGYIRVSTIGQVVEGLSLEAQRAKVEAWCQLNDYQLVAVFEDAGISGKSMANRPGLRAALHTLAPGAALVAVSLSRLARSTTDMLHIGATIEKRGADLVSLSEKLDSTSAAGKMLFRLFAVLNEFERDRTAERTTAILRHKRAKREVYGRTPFGFKEVAGHLVEVPEEAAIVSEMHTLRTQGRSLRAIAATLNARGIRPKQGGAAWYAETVKSVLHRHTTDLTLFPRPAVDLGYQAVCQA